MTHRLPAAVEDDVARVNRYGERARMRSARSSTSPASRLRTYRARLGAVVVHQAPG
jgi:hypothetical protein